MSEIDLKKCNPVLVLVLFFFLVSGKVQSQQTDTSKSFIVSLEFRPRFEVRNGYRTLNNDTTLPAYLVSLRSRINFDFAVNKLRFRTLIQHVRVWGQYGLEPAGGSLNVFEAYAGSYINSFLNLRLGWQSVQIDNGRLFSKSDWRQASKAHNGNNFRTPDPVIQLIASFISQNEKHNSEGVEYELPRANE